MANFFIALEVYAMLAGRTSYGNVSNWNWRFEDLTIYDIYWANCIYDVKISS